MFNWFKKIKARINVEEDSQELSPRAKPPTPKEAFHTWITKTPPSLDKINSTKTRKK